MGPAQPILDCSLIFYLNKLNHYFIIYFYTIWIVLYLQIVNNL